MAAPSGSTERAILSESSLPWGPPVDSPPKAPKATLLSERFIALHIIRVRMRPEAPTSAPLMISTLLPITNPAADAASPEYEFRSEITTGMSAPPIGSTSNIPRDRAAIVKIKKVVRVVRFANVYIPIIDPPRKRSPINRAAFSVF